MELQNVYKLISGTLGIRLASLPISLMTSIVLARGLGPEKFGSYAFLTTLILFVQMPVMMGIPRLVLRETARNDRESNWPEISGLLSWGKRNIFFSGIFGLFATISIMAYFPSVRANVNMETIVFAILTLPLIAMTELSVAAIQGFGYVVTGQLINNLLKPSMFVLAISGLFILGKATLSNVFLALLAVNILVYCFASKKEKEFAPNGLKKIVPILLAKKWIRSAWPMWTTGAMHVINTRTDILMLSYFEDPTVVGKYRVAQRGVELLLIGVMATDSVLAPLISKEFRQKNWLRLQSTITRLSRLLTMFVIIEVSLVYFFGNDLILMLFGSSYTGSWDILIILCLGPVMLSVVGRGGVLLTMTNFEKFTARLMFFSMIANIALNFILIPSFGAQGAAIATVIILAIREIVANYLARKKTGIDTSIIGYSCVDVR